MKKQTSRSSFDTDSLKKKSPKKKQKVSKDKKDGENIQK